MPEHRPRAAAAAGAGGDRLTPLDWRGELGRLAEEVGRRTRHAADRLERLVDRDPYLVAGYRGYGAGTRALVLGRAMQDEGIAQADPAASRWRNLLHALKRLESDPLPFAAVGARIAGFHAELRADDEGFVREWVELPAPLAAGGWHPVTLELRREDGPALPGTGMVLTPSSGTRFGVISDMDDTVLQSRVTDFVRAAGTVLLENARTRLPFPGVAAFYRALAAGSGGGEASPIFYVSNSPWNLYDVISDFLAAQEIPVGPVLLRDWDLGLRLRRRPPHKPGAIAEILTTYPDLPFILVGDSGQEDPEIYSAIVRDHPGRILAVYIRNVRPHPERVAAVRRLAAQVVADGSALVLADDTLTAARHAAEHGWIDPASLGEIGGEKRDDRGETGAKAPAPGTAPTVEVPPVVVEQPGDLP
ncbi:MAG TPA: phosphatase domain-containing protein [Gemmatimonadales bacterium]|nr:phosphatase domain-containing protein [Gemmatimonadales bacterium]